MASATTQAAPGVNADPVLINALHSAVTGTMAMGDIAVECVAMSTVPSREAGLITGLIGVSGDVTGFVTVNVSEMIAYQAVSALLLEECKELDHQVIDGIGELTNMVAGGIKKGLANSEWAFSDVTVPSVIVGQKYDIAFSQGFHYLSLTFENLSCDSLMVRDRLMRASLSLFRR